MGDVDGDGWLDEEYTPDLKYCTSAFGCEPLGVPNPHKDPLTYFRAFFDDNIVETIVNETNHYAHQTWKVGQAEWHDVTKPEFLHFISDILVMGVVKFPNRGMYWANGPFAMKHRLAIPTFARFEQILSKLHFVDNGTMPPEGHPERKTYKVKPLFDHINRTAKKFMRPGRSIAVDEQGIRSKHHSGIQQYNPNKPAKRHLKVWCAALENGYVWHVKLYGGKTKEGLYKDKKDKGNTGLGESVVLDMADTVDTEHHHFVFDNYFTSPALLRKLLEMGHYGTGTLRKNRKDFPKQLVGEKRMPIVVSKKSERGTCKIRVKRKVVFTSLMDTKPVNFASTFYASWPTATVSRKMKDPKEKDPKKRYKKMPQVTPVVHAGYGDDMGFVDLADQYKKSHGVDLRCRKWTKAAFCYFVNTLRVQSFLYAKEDGYGKNNKKAHGEFVTSVIGGLRSEAGAGSAHHVSPNKIVKVAHGWSHDVNVRRTRAGAHWCVIIEGDVDSDKSDEETHTPYGSCVWCRHNGCGRKKTHYACELCKVSLHPECMKAFHAF